jgi:dTDP-4-dehydrorhamnose 3,5-epimerase-like enzyme
MGSLLKQPRVLPGGLAVDDRGQITFVNDFSFSEIKRFYMVENFSTDVVRAFHGHLNEEKFVLVLCGSALVAAVNFGAPEKPDGDAPVVRFILSERQPQILYIPAGYANGFRCLESHTKIMFFSTATLEESRGDDFRFPYNQWGVEVWQVENR